MPEEKKNKEAYSIKLHKSFREEIEIAKEVEGITFTALVERELGRYLRAYKRACIDFKRKKDIEKELKKSKDGY